MIAYVHVGGGEWSIAEVDTDGSFDWWCGPRHEWVSPNSDYWQVLRDVWNVRFPSLASAKKFAKSKGWPT